MKCLKTLWKQLKSSWIYLVLFGFILFTHCYKLSSIPSGINVDEAGIYYDSWSLLHYGVNRQLDSWPLYLQNYGGGMSILYVYLCIPLIAIFGISLTVIRIPIVVFTLLTAIYGLRIIQMRQFRAKWLEYAFLFSLAVMPIFVVMFRFALDCNLMLGASTIFLYYLLRALDSGQNKYYLLTSVTGGIVLYTYILSHIVMPVFLLITIIFLIINKKFLWRKWFLTAIPMGILAAPLIGIHLISYLGLEPKHIGIFTLIRLWSYNERSGSLSLIHLFQSIPTVLKCMLWRDENQFDTLEQFPPMFSLSIAFVLTGLIVAVMACKKYTQKQSNNLVTPVLLFWLISEFLMGCLQGLSGLTSYKINAIYFVLLFLILEGIDCLSQLLSSKAMLHLSFVTFIIAFYCVRGGLFLHYYFTDYVKDTYPISLFAGNMTEAVAFVDSINKNHADIYISDFHKVQMYYTIAKLPSPYEQTFPATDYGNVHYYLPDTIDYNAIYIIRDTDIDSIQKLLDYGFSENVCGEYHVFYFNWNEYLIESADIPYTIDHLEIQPDSSIIFSGWSLNPTTGLPWDIILFQTDNKYYSSTKTERKDVATLVGTEQVKNCGYQFNLPNIQNATQGCLIFVDKDSKTIYREIVSLSSN